MPRMKILNSVEREVFDFPPIFNSVERKRCFDFPAPLQDIATSLRTASNQLVFLLSCGYFKATKRFYPVPTFHRRDLTLFEVNFSTVFEVLRCRKGMRRVENQRLRGSSWSCLHKLRARTPKDTIYQTKKS